MSPKLHSKDWMLQVAVLCLCAVVVISCMQYPFVVGLLQVQCACDAGIACNPELPPTCTSTAQRVFLLSLRSFSLTLGAWIILHMLHCTPGPPCMPDFQQSLLQTCADDENAGPAGHVSGAAWPQDDAHRWQHRLAGSPGSHARVQLRPRHVCLPALHTRRRTRHQPHFR